MFDFGFTGNMSLTGHARIDAGCRCAVRAAPRLTSVAALPVTPRSYSAIHARGCPHALFGSAHRSPNRVALRLTRHATRIRDRSGPYRTHPHQHGSAVLTDKRSVPVTWHDPDQHGTRPCGLTYMGSPHADPTRPNALIRSRMTPNARNRSRTTQSGRIAGHGSRLYEAGTGKGCRGRTGCVQTTYPGKSHLSSMTTMQAFPVT
jgi:hypothetical protein